MPKITGAVVPSYITAILPLEFNVPELGVGAGELVGDALGLALGEELGGGEPPPGGLVGGGAALPPPPPPHAASTAQTPKGRSEAEIRRSFITEILNSQPS
jgi:hypothetical protein